MQTLEDDDCVIEYADEDESESFSITTDGMRAKVNKFRSTFDIHRRPQFFKNCTCFLVAEILIQGTMFVTDRHLCFSSGIPGLKRTIKFDFRDITSITKDKVYAIFPTGICVRTSNEKVLFSHVKSRDKLYQLLTSSWKSIQERQERSSSSTSSQESETSNNNGVIETSILHSRSEPNFSPPDIRHSSLTTQEVEADDLSRMSDSGIGQDQDDMSLMNRSSKVSTPESASSHSEVTHSTTPRLSSSLSRLIHQAFKTLSHPSMRFAVICLALLLVNAVIIVHLSTRMFAINEQISVLSYNNAPHNPDNEMDIKSKSFATKEKSLLSQDLSSLVQSLTGIQQRLVQIKSSLKPLTSNCPNS